MRRRPAPHLALALVTLAFAGGVGTGLVVLPPATAGADLADVSAERVSAPSGTPEATAAPTPAPDPAAAVSVPVDPDALDAEGLSLADRAAGLLSTEVPPRASGELEVVAGAVPGPGAAPVRTVRVEVEQGLPVDAALFAATVMNILNDPRGWDAGGAMTFARTDGDAEFRVVLASPGTIDTLCAPLRTNGEFSCGRSGHAAINLARWTAGASEFGADRTRYRQYVINHEVGHLLGHPHERCPGAGQVAPIMQQQSAGVAPCLPNGWPHPTG